MSVTVVQLAGLCAAWGLGERCVHMYRVLDLVSLGIKPYRKAFYCLDAQSDSYTSHHFSQLHLRYGVLGTYGS